MFVIATDVEKNIVYVGEGHKHPGLYRKTLFIKTNDIHTINYKTILSKINGVDKIKVRIRYRQELQDAKLIMVNGGIIVWFNELQRGITPGQFAAFYTEDNELIGSGIIN